MRDNPFSFVDPVHDPEMFVGRHVERDAILKRLRSTLFIGEAKSGKSSLLNQLQDDLRTVTINGARVCPICISAKTGLAEITSQTIQNIVSHVVEFSRRELGDTVVAPLQNSPRDLLEMLDGIDAAGHRLLIVCLLDDLHEAAGQRDAGPRFCQALRHVIDSSPEGARLVMIAAARSSFLTSEGATKSTLLSRFEHVCFLTGLLPHETDQLMRKVEPIDRRPNAEISPSLVDLVHDQTGGHPYLVQKTMYRAIENASLRGESLDQAARAVMATLAHDVPVFSEWTQQLTFEEAAFLLAMALRLPVDEWHLGLNSLQRFVSMGIVTLEHSEDCVRPIPVCGVFFDWLREQATHFVQLTAGRMFGINDLTSITALFETTLRRALGKQIPKNERQLQDCVQSMLAACRLEFEREKNVSPRAGKGFRVDFFLPKLELAIEVKLVTSGKRASKLVDELLADVAAYATTMKYVLFLILDTTGLVKSDEVAECSDLYNVRYTVIQTLASEEAK